MYKDCRWRHTDFVKVLSDLVASKCFYVVENEGRGRGLARSIIETLISRLHSEGVTRIELMLEADNPRALSFYTKLGFELDGTMRSAYKRSSDENYVDEIFMARLLPPLVDRGETQIDSNLS